MHRGRQNSARIPLCGSCHSHELVPFFMSHDTGNMATLGIHVDLINFSIDKLVSA